MVMVVVVPPIITPMVVMVMVMMVILHRLDQSRSFGWDRIHRLQQGDRIRDWLEQVGI